MPRRCTLRTPTDLTRLNRESTVVTVLHYISYYLTHNLNDMSEQAELTSARYGKTKVRVLRVVRDDKWHHVVEYNVEALLEGDIATR